MSYTGTLNTCIFSLWKCVIVLWNHNNRIDWLPSAWYCVFWARAFILIAHYRFKPRNFSKKWNKLLTKMLSSKFKQNMFNWWASKQCRPWSDCSCKDFTVAIAFSWESSHSKFRPDLNNNVHVFLKSSDLFFSWFTSSHNGYRDYNFISRGEEEKVRWRYIHTYSKFVYLFPPNWKCSSFYLDLCVVPAHEILVCFALKRNEGAEWACSLARALPSPINKVQSNFYGSNWSGRVGLDPLMGSSETWSYNFQGRSYVLYAYHGHHVFIDQSC